MCFVFFRAWGQRNYYIRSFETDNVSTHECAADNLVRVKVQHGDVVAVSGDTG